MTLEPSISVIIPVLNEAAVLDILLPYLKAASKTDAVCEVIIADGGSSDDSVRIAKKHGARLVLSNRGRAIQMNRGAQKAHGDILYFLHADSVPPVGFDYYIRAAMATGKKAGCFRMRFDSASRLLALFAWFTRLNLPLCRGGDQSLFLPADWFRELGGFNEAYHIYEDNEFTGRIYGSFPFEVLPQSITTSARRYRKAGILPLQYHFGVIHLKKLLGAKPESLYRYYARNISG